MPQKFVCIRVAECIGNIPYPLSYIRLSLTL